MEPETKRICGTSTPPHITIKNNITIKFHSDNSEEKNGFVIQYTTHTLDKRSLAAVFTGETPYADAEVILLSPQLNITSPACVKFKYSLRSQLEVSVKTANDTRSVLNLNMDTGGARNADEIQVHPGDQNIMWKHRYSFGMPARQMAYSYDLYSIALDDIELIHGPCKHSK